MGLTGIARIQPDDELRIETEGGEKALETFVNWCKAGPNGTTVNGVRVQNGPLQGCEKFLAMHQTKSQPSMKAGFWLIKYNCYAALKNVFAFGNHSISNLTTGIFKVHRLNFGEPLQSH